MFKREILYRSQNLIELLSEVKVVVCGVGAIGSNLVDALCRIGFSSLKIVDFDRVTIENISTQVWEKSEVGALKVNALKSKVFRTTGVEVEVVNKKLKDDNIAQIIKKKEVWVVIDALDNTEGRQLLKRYCEDNCIGCLHLGLSADGCAEAIWNQNYRVPEAGEGDPCDVPLARNLVMLIVAIATEEILDYCLEESPRKANWAITLKDLKITRQI